MKPEAVKFKDLIHTYCRVADYSQQTLAKEIALHPTAFSRKLNQTKGTFFSRSEIKNLIKVLSREQIITRQTEALELLELVGLSVNTFSEDEWKTAPLNRLEREQVTSNRAIAVPAANFTAKRSRPEIVQPVEPVTTKVNLQPLTFLFTDIENSTGLWESYPDAMSKVLVRHNQLIQQTVRANEGQLFKAMGDGFGCYFLNPKAALMAALAIQRAIRSEVWEAEIGRLRVRVALHTGIPEIIEETGTYPDFAGQVLNRVARLVDLAHSEQVLLSLVTAELIRPHLGADLKLRDLGEYRLKGFQQPERVFQLLAPDLPADFATPVRLAKVISSSENKEIKKKEEDPTFLREDWGEAPALQAFYGREEERATVKRWVIEERCRLVALLGMGGIGKTSLMRNLAEKLKFSFDYLFWRSLRNSPSLEEVLLELLEFSGGGQIEELHNPARLVSLLLGQLRKTRCLIILDNAETVLQEDNPYRQEYELLFNRLGETAHRSCLILTSRERPRSLSSIETKNSAIRNLRLSGISPTEGGEILRECGLSGRDKEITALTKAYSGNPLALKLVSEVIRELFAGDIAKFLKAGKIIFMDVREILGQQLTKLTEVEKTLLYWLALEREAVSLEALAAKFSISVPLPELVEALMVLRRRSLIEPGETGGTFTLQNVVLEYLTDQLVEQTCQEIGQGKIELLTSHPLIQTQAKEFIRRSQERLLLQPLLDRLRFMLKSTEAVARQLGQLLALVREKPRAEQGYAGGNLFNLLVQLQNNTDLKEYDFSNLNLWQANLQGHWLQDLNLQEADLSGALFTETFDGVMALAFSLDRHYLAMGSVNGQVRVWQLDDVRPVFTVRGHTKTVRSVFFSADNTLLASASDDGEIKLWALDSGKLVRTLAGHINRVWSVAFSPDGKLVASGGEDRTVKVWRVEDGECLFSLTGHTNWVRSVAFSPDGKLVASAGGDRLIRLWDIGHGENVAEFVEHTARVRSVAFSPDGRLLASGGEDQTIRLWEVSEGRCLGTLTGHTGRIRSIAFGAGGTVLASGGDDQTVKLWDLNSQECIDTLYEHGGWIWVVAFSSDGTLLATGGEDQAIRLWEVSTGKCLRTIQGYSTWVGAVAFNPDGSTLASGGENQAVELWDASGSNRRCLKRLPGHTNRLRTVAFSPDGKFLASGGEDCKIRLWHMSEGIIHLVLSGHTSRVRAVSFSPDSQTLASVGEDSCIRLWEVATGREIKVFPRLEEWLGTIAFSPNGRWLATNGEDNTAIVWDLETSQIITRFEGHTDRVRAVAFSPDGQWLATGSVDRTAGLWEISTGKCLTLFKGHTDRVRAVAFSPDGQWLATGSEDWTIRLWRKGNEAAIYTLVGHDDRVWSVDFSPNGKWLASAGEDGTIRLWDWTAEQVLKVLQSERPYERLNIRGATGLSQAQKITLKALGAIS